MEYADLRGLGWPEARRVLALEAVLIDRIERSADGEAESELIEQELFESAKNLYGLDLGVASTVVCLSAAKCIPFTSCNAAAFGGSHREEHPLVAFFVRSRTADLLMTVAEEANIGLTNGAHGCLLASAADIRDMRVFANGIIRRRRLFTAMRGRQQRS